MKKIFSNLMILSALAQSAFASAPIRNLTEYKNVLGFDQFYSRTNNQRPLKVAIIADDFSGATNETGRTLPPNTQVFTFADDTTSTPLPGVVNGTTVAQVVTGYMTDEMRSRQWMPELKLYTVKSLGQFEKALDQIISQQTDIVLNTQTWATGNNFDNSGYLPTQISRVLSRKILWINTTGDGASSVFRSPVQTVQDNWVQLPDRNNALMFRCENNRTNGCEVHIKLSWNSSNDNLQKGTNKDLDLALTDDLLTLIKTSTLRQVVDNTNSNSGETTEPAESISARIPPGVYYVLIKNRSLNFGSRDQLQVVVSGDSVRLNTSTSDAALLSPADHPEVISVGAIDTPSSSTSQSINKPELKTYSRLQFEDGTNIASSTSAAAIVTAGIALLKTEMPLLEKFEILRRVQRPSDDWNQRGLPLRLLAFNPTGPGCFWDVNLNPVPQYMREVLSRGGVPVETTAAIRIMTPFDPIQMAPYLRRYAIDDMIVALPWGGYDIFPRYGRIPEGAIEIFQRPQEAGLCRPRSNPGGNNFHL